MNYHYRIYKIENGYKYYVSSYIEGKNKQEFYANFEVDYTKAMLFSSQSQAFKAVDRMNGSRNIFNVEVVREHIS